MACRPETIQILNLGKKYKYVCTFVSNTDYQASFFIGQCSQQIINASFSEKNPSQNTCSILQIRVAYDPPKDWEK